MFLRIKNADQSCTQNTFVDHFIQPVDYLLRFSKEFFYFPKYHKKCSSNNWDNKQHRQTKLPISNKQQDTRADNQNERSDHCTDYLRNKCLYRVYIGSEIRQ